MSFVLEVIRLRPLEHDTGEGRAYFWTATSTRRLGRIVVRGDSLARVELACGSGGSFPAMPTEPAFVEWTGVNGYLDASLEHRTIVVQTAQVVFVRVTKLAFGDIGFPVCVELLTLGNRGTNV